MEFERRKLKRKPLSDCTNITLPCTKSPKCSISTRKSDENSFKCDTSTGSNNDENPRIPSQPSTPLQPKTSAYPAVDCEISKIVTDYSRRCSVEKTKDKGKAVAVVVPFSCPPAGRIRSLGDGRNKEHRGTDKLNEVHKDVDLSKVCTVPRPKSKKKRRFSLPEKHALPQDFIEKQRAYFAEIDAFELPEEVASESELE